MERFDSICLSGVRVNNLQNLSVQIPHNKVTVICGLSGSGKTSLAFDTLYAEGQRRYVETFSPSARQFLDRIERPLVDTITGLPPAIACRQNSLLENSRGTVGSRTDILTSLRILFARFGRLRCPQCGVDVDAATVEKVEDDVRASLQGLNCKILICATWLTQNGQEPHAIERLIASGFTRMIIADKLVRMAELPVDQRVPDDSLIVLDRIQSDRADDRLAESVKTALDLSGRCVLLVDQKPVAGFEATRAIDGVSWSAQTWTSSAACAQCRIQFPQLSPELFNERSPLGACPDCKGTGEQQLKTPPRKGRKTAAQPRSTTHTKQPCEACRGDRLNPIARAAEWNEKTLSKWLNLEATEFGIHLHQCLQAVPESTREAIRPIVEHIDQRLGFLNDTGLGYLSMGRSLQTLSGGEAQRVVLTSILGSNLVGTLFVLDEPTTGLHPGDSSKVLACIRSIQQNGNTVVIVEHDLEAIRLADHVIELGPAAGENGGRVVFEGTPLQLNEATTITAEKLREADTRARERQQSTTSLRIRRSPEQWLKLSGVNLHNIQNMNVDLPLGVLCAVSGVSGAGKSSLIKDALYPILLKHLHPERAAGDSVLCRPESIAAMSGMEQIESVLLLDQRPIRRSVRSIPATWIGVFDEIRILMAETHEARRRNYSRMMFSFNASKGGRCPVCEGRGIITVPMQFLADVETTCEECRGQRFRPDVIEVRYRDRSIFDILNMTADEAFRFFNGHHRIQSRINAMRQSGLGYLRLGQSLATLSGGESQRLRLAAMLAGIPLTEGETAASNRKSSGLVRSGRTLFLLDEPSCGLHPHDIDALVASLDFLVQTGHSVVVIEHDRQLLQHADWIIELGPGPGRLGGRVVHSGPELLD